MRWLGAGGVALAGLRGARAKPARDKRPNIIVFLTDDQDKHSLGAYGGKSLTPELDRMAAEGMVFHKAFVTSTVCTPSRYSFLTGRYASRARSPRYLAECPPGMQAFPAFNVALEEDNMNLGAVLSAAGYRTGYTGKFHVGPELRVEEQSREFGLKHTGKDAKDTAEVSEAFRTNELRYREYLKKRGFQWVKNVYWGNMKKPYSMHNLEWTVAAALEFIEDSKDRPFYLHCCTTLVHGPDKSWSKSMQQPLVTGAGRGKVPITPEGMTPRAKILAELRQAGLDPDKGHAGYRWVDAGVGAILRKLKALGIDDNTLVIFTADHGSNMKGSLFDVDGACVPMIARWPGGIKAGSHCRQLVQSIDIAATAFDLAKARVPERYVLDGRSLRPLLGGATAKGWRDHVYLELGFGRAVRTDDWKYIAVRYTTPQIKAIRSSAPARLPKLMSPLNRSGIGTRGAKNPNFYGEDQLYHVKRDGLEKRNLASTTAHREQLATMRAILLRDLRSIGRPFGELVPGGNAAKPGQVVQQMELVRRIRIQGKKVTLPPDVEAGRPPGTGQTKDQRRAGRQKRREQKRDENP